MVSVLKINVVKLAVFTALIYVFTVVIQFYQPFTGGYFNLGEAAIYTCALISDPLTTAFAAGIGSSLADATTGYGIFAPATLVIKFTEGYVASMLFRKIGSKDSSVASWFVSLIYFVGIVGIGTKYFSGSMSVSAATFNYTYSLYIPWEFWVIVGLVVLFIPLIMEKRMRSGAKYGSLLLAGTLMVAGYFLYEFFVSNPLTGRPSSAALFEVPVNFGQALVGAVVAIPAYNFLKKAGYAE